MDSLEPINKKAPDEKFCSECGAIIKAKAEICPKCGVRQKSAPSTYGRSRTVAALFAFFWGGIGVHKFYLGQVGSGILYLLFCWTLIPGIIAFVEFILLISMTDDAFNQKYGNV